MGLLVNGQWKDQWYDTKATGGKFERKESAFRNQVTADGSSGFAAEPLRYHLYVSLACPWAHRALIFRKLKKLERVVSVSTVTPLMLENGWEFDQENPDGLLGHRYLYEVYTAADRNYNGRVTVPVLWDKQKATIVNNESSEIIRMLNSEFNEFGDASVDFSPLKLRREIDEINAFIYENVNNGVYRAGFATTREAYETAYDSLFSALDELERRLSRQRYLVGRQLTEADWRLFTTLVRFDAVYYSHFKCNRQRMADYPNLFNYLLELYQVPGVAETVRFDHIKTHYYGSHRMINATAIIPKGPELDYTKPHDRNQVAPMD